jgi:hypothetical protein
MRAGVRRAGLVVFGLIIGLALAEIWLRLSPPIAPQYMLPLPYKHDELRRVAREETYIRFDAALGWLPTPDSSHQGGDIPYRTNRAGLRAEREYPLGPPPETRRLAAFGDSFTYCEEVELEDCWTTQLQRQWPRGEVLNFGVPGYGPDQAWLRYQREGRAYQPCAVLIGYLVENINRVVNRFRPFYEPAGGLVLSKPRYLLAGEGLELLPNPVENPEDLDDPLWVEDTLGPHDNWYFPGLFVANPFDGLLTVRLSRTVAARRPDYEFTRDWEAQIAQAYRRQGEAFQVTARVLREFARQVREDGATPVVLVFGSEMELRAVRQRGEKVYAPLLEWLSREGIPTIDLTDDLAAQTARSSVSRLVGNHYTPMGNRLVASTLARRLPQLVGGTCGQDGRPRRGT